MWIIVCLINKSPKMNGNYRTDTSASHQTGQDKLISVPQSLPESFTPSTLHQLRTGRPRLLKGQRTRQRGLTSQGAESRKWSDDLRGNRILLWHHVTMSSACSKMGGFITQALHWTVLHRFTGRGTLPPRLASR